MMKRLDKFLYVLNLRQGTIFIAVLQIALSSCLLIVLLVGISHVGEMLSMLQSDMRDDAERRGFYEITYGVEYIFHEGDVMSTNNQRRFAKAQHLASVTVILLYTSTILLSIYLMCSISLLYGAVKCKRQYVVPWIMAECVAFVLAIVGLVIGDGYPNIVGLFGGHNLYHFTGAFIVLTFAYNLYAVGSFVLETGGSRCAREVQTYSDERGERLVLLDHAAHSSLLSAAQLNKLSQGTRSQFV